jgi:lipopolysaccharide export system permease protein
MAVGKFSSANEIIAFKASGISLKKIFLPLVVFGILLSAVSFIMNDYFLPLGTMNFGKLYRKLLYAHPELEIEPFSVKNYEDSIIANGRVDEKGIEDILIIDKEPEGTKRVITAGHGSLDKSIEGVIGLVLTDVNVHSLGGKDRERYSYSTAEKMVYNILLKNITPSIRNPGPREMSSYDVYREIRAKTELLNLRKAEQAYGISLSDYAYRMSYGEVLNRVYRGEISFETGKENLDRRLSALEAERKKKIQDRSLRIYLIEFYKKFSIPFSCLAFVFLAFPVGLFTRRSGRSVGFGLGLFVSIFYWGMLVAGQTLGIRAEFSPFLSMWIPNAVILFLAATAFILRAIR